MDLHEELMWSQTQARDQFMRRRGNSVLSGAGTVLVVTVRDRVYSKRGKFCKDMFKELIDCKEEVLMSMEQPTNVSS